MKHLGNHVFRIVNEAALKSYPFLVREWLPRGRLEGSYWVAINPTRHDQSLGSFKVNLYTGHWADYATGDWGGDPVSLYAYLFGTANQYDAARILGRELDAYYD